MSPLSGELWPAHPKPLPDELLTSWIARCAKANGLKLQTFCDRVFGKERQLWNRDIDRLAPEWLLAEMAKRTGTPYAAAERTTLSVYRGRLFHERHSAGQLRWILPVGIYHRTRQSFGLQFCTQCLFEDDEPYFRTRWRVAAMPFCKRHGLLLHDKCPKCIAPVSFHRRELGRPEITEPGPLCLCHTCDFDLRNARPQPFSPCDNSIADFCIALGCHILGEPSVMNIGHMDVLHQLCKVIIGPQNKGRLAAFIADIVDVERHEITGKRRTFESMNVADRAHVIQMAAWLLADTPIRIQQAWRGKSLRRNLLTRDFREELPSWYTSCLHSLQ